MTPPKLKKADVVKLYQERSEIIAWLTPPKPEPDPNQWPPQGWVECNDGSGNLYQVKSADDLRKELFGDPEREAWLEAARQRINEIELLLIPYFFPENRKDAKEEGIERKTKVGFHAVIDRKVKRKIDRPALDDVLERCQQIADEKGHEFDVEERVIDYKPSLKLTEYRELPKAIQAQFDNALEISDPDINFDIVEISDEGED